MHIFINYYVCDFFFLFSLDFMSLSGFYILTAPGLWFQVEKSLPEVRRYFSKRENNGFI